MGCKLSKKQVDDQIAVKELSRLVGVEPHEEFDESVDAMKESLIFFDKVVNSPSQVLSSTSRYDEHLSVFKQTCREVFSNQDALDSTQPNSCVCSVNSQHSNEHCLNKVDLSICSPPKRSHHIKSPHEVSNLIYGLVSRQKSRMRTHHFPCRDPFAPLKQKVIQDNPVYEDHGRKASGVWNVETRGDTLQANLRPTHKQENKIPRVGRKKYLSIPLSFPCSFGQGGKAHPVSPICSFPLDTQKKGRTKTFFFTGRGDSRSTLRGSFEQNNAKGKFMSISSLEKDQRAILPSYLQTIPEFGEILLESSVVVGCLGQMVFLPWNEWDEDIVNGCWMTSWPSPLQEFFSRCSPRRDGTTDNRLASCHGDSSFKTSHNVSVGEKKMVLAPDRCGRHPIRQDEPDPPFSCTTTCSNLSSFQETSHGSRYKNDHVSKTLVKTPQPHHSFHDLSNGFPERTPPPGIVWESPLSPHSFFYSTPYSSRNESYTSLTPKVNGLEGENASSLTSDNPLMGWHTKRYQSCSSPYNKELGGVNIPPTVQRFVSQTHLEHEYLKEANEHTTQRTKGNYFHDTSLPPDTQHPSVLCRLHLLHVDETLSHETFSRLSLLRRHNSNVFIQGWSLVDGRFTDPDGYISLSKKQQKKFYAWKRITQIKTHDRQLPCIIKTSLDSRLIQQGFVGDCSFLSSLAVLVQYENTHDLPMVSSIIHPQKKDPETHQWYPVVNPSGFYACRVFYNGIARKVILDDYFPVRQDGKILSAHSEERNEFWVSLLEKCFVKLMGGSYFIPGSNPGTDIYHLTGWIPETIPFHSDIQSGSPENCHVVVTGGYDMLPGPLGSEWINVWDQLYDGLIHGKCVACLGTSEIADSAPSGLDYPEGVSRSCGIVARHAYSILGCFCKNSTTRLLYLKNPWCCIRWRGNYSPYDKKNWTQELQDTLNYKREQAAQVDDGYFWIEWSDVLQWFSHLYICWNPECFPFYHEIHSKWESPQSILGSILPDDSHLIAFNPQFLLSIDVQAYKKNTLHEVWIFLSRHVRERNRDLSQKYLAIHVYSGSQRLCCPPPPVKQGIYSNGECTLVKLLLDFSDSPLSTKTCIQPGEYPDFLPFPTLTSGSQPSTCPTLHDQEFVLVVSQYCQKEEFNFTLKTYSDIPTKITPLPPLIPNSSQVIRRYLKGSWTSTTAGGCSNHLWSFFLNPQARLSLPETYHAVMFLESPQEYSVNLRLVEGCHPTPRKIRSSKVLSSGAYRSGCCVIQTTLHQGDYTLMASTFNPGEVGDFQIILLLWPPSPKPSHPSYHVSDQIAFKFVPYPYAVPPSPYFFYRKITVNDQVLKKNSFSSQSVGFGAIFRFLADGHASEKVDIAFQLYTKGLFSFNVFPSMVLYRSRSPESYVLRLPPLSDLEIVCFSDLEGGYFNASRSFSSATNEFYKTMNINTMTAVGLKMHTVPYFLAIRPAVLKRGNQHLHPCLVPLDPNQYAQIFMNSNESQEFTLHVMSDTPVSMTLVG